MKQFLLFAFLLLAARACAQHKTSIGLLAGGNISSPSYTNFNQRFETGLSAGAEGQFRLVSQLFGSVRSEFQSLTIHFKSQNPYFPTSQTMYMGNLQAGLQWKKSWWYGGAGIYGQLMLQKFFEAETGAICDCDGIVYFPPVYKKQSYDGAGYYFQTGLTPKLSKNTRLLMELNAYHLIPSLSSGNWSYQKRFMPGLRVGAQRKL